LALAPSIPTVYVNLADVQRAAGKEDASRATLRAGLAIAPDNAALWHALGLAFVRSHERAKALIALKKAADLAPGERRFTEVYEIARKEFGR
jgi:Flp pilus assembly protein TadD